MVLSDSFIYFMYRMLNEIFNRLVMCMDIVAALPHAHIDSLHTHTMDNLKLCFKGSLGEEVW